MKRPLRNLLVLTVLVSLTACAGQEAVLHDPDGLTYDLFEVRDEEDVVKDRYFRVTGHLGEPVGARIPATFDLLPVKVVADHAFHAARKLEAVEFVDNLWWIGYEAFAYCDRLQTISLPKTMYCLDGRAFSHCLSLTDADLGASLMVINPYAFVNCTALLNVRGGENLRTIGDFAFQNCASINELVIPAKLKRIGVYAFINCTGIKEIRIPNTVEYMGTGAFYGWTSEQTIIVEDGGCTCDWSPHWTLHCDATIEHVSPPAPAGA